MNYIEKWKYAFAPISNETIIAIVVGGIIAPIVGIALEETIRYLIKKYKK